MTFETFFHDFELKCKSTEEQDVQSPDNSGSETTLGNKKGDEIRHCTLDQVENLNEKIQSKISTMLQDKGIIYMIIVEDIIDFIGYIGIHKTICSMHA